MTHKEFNIKLGQHSSFLFEKAIFFTKNHQDALDLVQETLLKSLSNFHNYDGHSNIKGWLYVILRNTFINHYHKNKYERKFKCNLEVAEYATTRKSNIGFYTAYSKLELEDIMREVNKLPEDYFTPFMMHYRGYKYQEISEKSQLPLGTIKTRIHKARNLIKKKLERAGIVRN
ncbi:MAG TPA: RNA polymerase sigma factor [Sphingobacterium sp.]|nr:RNA polymerase sigma factor [Sphingobacterium sp.]